MIFKQNLFTDTVQEVNCTFEQFCNRVKSPKRYGEKKACPLGAFYTLVDEPILTDAKMVRGISENMDTLDMLFIEFDDGRTYESFIKEFGSFQFALYTSWSHTEDNHRFRVLMPLETPLKNAYLESKHLRNWLAMQFRGCDTSAFHRFHMQIVPVLRPGYKYHINESEQKFVIPREVIDQTWLDHLTDKRREAEELKQMELRGEHYSVENSPSVVHYLTTSYTKMSGNGDSSISLYRALYACIRANDEETKERVLSKARMENWSERELTDKIRSASR